MTLSLLLCLVVILKLVSSDQQLYYITAFPNGTPCPEYYDVVCEPLSFYLNGKEDYFVDNTTLHFLDGVHSLPSETITFNKIIDISLIGDEDVVYEESSGTHRSTTVLECSDGIGGIAFYSSELVSIVNITITNCTTPLNNHHLSADTSVNASLLIVDSKDIFLHNLSIRNSKNHGLLIKNSYDVNVFDSSFWNNALDGSSWNVIVTFSDVDYPFSNDYIFRIDSTNITSSGYGGIAIYFAQQEYLVTMFLTNSRVSRNDVNVFVHSNGSCQYFLFIEGFECSHSLSNGFVLKQESSCWNKSFIPGVSIEKSNFLMNSFTAMRIYWLSNDLGDVFIESSNFTENIGAAVSCILIQQLRLSAQASKDLFVQFTDLRFVGNQYNSEEAMALGFTSDVRFTVLFINIQLVFVDSCTFTGNFGSGIVLFQSHVNFEGDNVFQGNSASVGAALILISNSILFMNSNSTLSFINNSVIVNGGAIFIAQYIPRLYDTEGDRGLYADCFYQLDEPITESISGKRNFFSFQNNTAGVAGSAIYGGIIDNCLSLAAGDISRQTSLQTSVHSLISLVTQ